MKYHARNGSFTLTAGVLAAIVSLLLMSGGGSSPVTLGLAVLCIVIGAIKLANPLLVLEDDHFTYRGVAYAPQRRVLYRDVRGLWCEGEQLRVDVDPAAGPAVTILLAAFAVPARSAIVEELDRRVARPFSG
jgi:hypothetical protein